MWPNLYESEAEPTYVKAWFYNQQPSRILDEGIWRPSEDKILPEQVQIEFKWQSQSDPNINTWYRLEIHTSNIEKFEMTENLEFNSETWTVMIHLHRPVIIKEELPGKNGKVFVTSFLDLTKVKRDSTHQLANLWNVAQVIKLRGRLAADTNEQFYLDLINSSVLSNFGRRNASDQASLTQTYSDSLDVDDYRKNKLLKFEFTKDLSKKKA